MTVWKTGNCHCRSQACWNVSTPVQEEEDGNTIDAEVLKNQFSIDEMQKNVSASQMCKDWTHLNIVFLETMNILHFYLFLFFFFLHFNV